MLLQFTIAKSQTQSECPNNPVPSLKEIKELARTTQPDRGPLWSVSKGGKNSFLYGTIHVAKLEWDFPGATVRNALNSSNELIIELDITDPSLKGRMNAGKSDRANSKGGSDEASNAQADSFKARVSKQFKAACLDEGKFTDANLSSKIVSLSLLSARDAGLYPDYAIDAALIGYARARGKRVIEIETPEEQARALASGSAEMTDSSISRLESGETRGQILRLASAWAVGNYADIEAYFTWCRCSVAAVDVNKLITLRNIVIAERLGQAFDARSNVFAAIGVLHTIGTDGIVEILKRHGFSVERVSGFSN